MGVWADVPESLIAEAVARWQRGALRTCAPTPHGIENSNFFVTTETDDGRQHEWVLTVMEQPPEPTGLQVLARLAAVGAPVPAPVATPGGDAVTEVDGHPALLAPRLAGTHPDAPDRSACAAVGRFLATMHRHCADLSGPDHPRDRAWLERGRDLHRTRLSADRRGLLERAVAGCAAASRRRDWAALPSGIVHGDLFRDNALMAGHRLTGVIDFHHAARAPLLFDLAVVANDWCADPDAAFPGALDPERVGALLRGYTRLRPLTRLELAFWPTMLALAALRFWVARLDSPRKDPEEMARRLACHLARPMFLDPGRVNPAA